jgi:arsenate reductase-like glutaredoxin family protein
VSLFNVLGFAAINDAKRRIAESNSQSVSSSQNATEFASQVEQSQIDFDSVDSTVVSRGLTHAEIETLYSQVRQEADALFESFSEAYLALSTNDRSPTRLEILQHISRHNPNIQISMLNSNQINALIDFYLEYSNPEDDERIDSSLSSSDREAAERREAEILLEAIILSAVLKNRGKAESKSKKERKKARKEEEKQEQKYIQELQAQKKRLNSGRAKKK